MQKGSKQRSGPRGENEIPAILWLGEDCRIPGALQEEPLGLRFQLTSPENSHFNLFMPWQGLTAIREFLLFGHGRNGIIIESRSGQADRFVVEDAEAAKVTLRQWWSEGR